MGAVSSRVIASHACILTRNPSLPALPQNDPSRLDWLVTKDLDAEPFGMGGAGDTTGATSLLGGETHGRSQR